MDLCTFLPGHELLFPYWTRLLCCRTWNAFFIMNPPAFLRGHELLLYQDMNCILSLDTSTLLLGTRLLFCQDMNCFLPNGSVYISTRTWTAFPEWTCILFCQEMNCFFSHWTRLLFYQDMNCFFPNGVYLSTRTWTAFYLMASTFLPGHELLSPNGPLYFAKITWTTCSLVDKSSFLPEPKTWTALVLGKVNQQ